MNNQITDFTYYDITLLVEDPDDSSKLRQYIPKTYIEGVFLDPEQKHCAKDHLSNLIHLHKHEREEIFKHAGSANGAVILDGAGKIPLQCFNKHQLFLHFEFDTIQEMLEENDYTDADKGHLVMVKDNTEKGLSGWVIYRFLGGDSSEYDNWQWVFCEKLSDLAATWDIIQGRPVSSTVKVDEMVRDAHLHDFNALDGFNLKNGELYWKDNKIMMKGAPTMFAADDHTVANDGDVVIERTDTFDPSSSDEGAAVVLGNCDGLYRGRTLTAGYHLDTNGVTSAVCFYTNCYFLETVPEYDMQNCKDVSYFVANCFKLMTFLTREFVSAEKAAGFFMNCKYLKRLPIMHFPLLEDASEFVKGCIRLETAGSFIAPLVKNINDFANGCKRLTTQIPFYDTSNVTSAARVYKNCEELVSASFNVPNAIDVSEAFSGCWRLRKLTSVDVRKAEDLSTFIRECSSLEEFEIVEGGLTKSLDFSNTSLSIESAQKLIEYLPEINDNQSLVFSNTPARDIDSSFIGVARRKGWTIVR